MHASTSGFQFHVGPNPTVCVGESNVKPPDTSFPATHRRSGPGGLGALPPRGSHRPVRARMRAYGSSDHGFATFRHPVLLSVPVSVTRGSDFDASVVVLKNGSMIRRLASLHWLQQGAVRQLQRKSLGQRNPWGHPNVDPPPQFATESPAPLSAS